MVVSARPNHTHLLLLATVQLIELPMVATVVTAFPEVAAASVFGSPGTQAVLIAALGASLWGVALAWSPAPPTPGMRRAVGASLGALAGVLAVPAVSLLISGQGSVQGILLAQCVIFMIIIAKQATRGAAPAPTSASSRRRWSFSAASSPPRPRRW